MNEVIEDSSSPEARFRDGVLHVLEQQAPRVDIPEGFAGRVAALAVSQKVPRMRLGLFWSRAGLGPRLAGAGAVLITVLMFLCAPRATPNMGNVWFDLELLLLVELGGVSWVAVRFGLFD